MKRTVFLAGLGLLLAGPAVSQHTGDFTDLPVGPGYTFGTVQPAPETNRGVVNRLGRQAGDNFCIPPQWNDSRGYMNLQEPGGNPGTCVFKSDVLTRQCECSTYRYRNVHTVGMGNDGATSTFTPSNYEEAAEGTQCISKVAQQSYGCSSDGYFVSCGYETVMVCPGGSS